MSAGRKAAGVALKVAAPEAAVASKAAGSAKRKQPVPDPRKTHPGSEAARQRQAVEDVKAQRKPEPDDQADDDQGDEHDDQADAGGGRFAPLAGMQGPATGGGFALGLIVWALVRAYIGNPGQPSGAAGVKALVNAKLFNKVTATTATK